MPSLTNRLKSLPGLTALRLLGKVLSLPKPSVLVGAGSSERLAHMVADQGYQRVLLITDKMLNQLGVTRDIEAVLQARGVDFQVFDEVMPDPTFDLVESGIRAIQAFRAQALLVVGGGSAMDAAKVMAMSIATGKAPRELVGVFKGRKPTLPLFVVPSTSGTGSEASVAAVISDAVTHEKSLVVDMPLVPRAAALDPVINRGMPPSVTAETGIDALTHAIEGYLSEFATPETDGYNLAACRLIFNNLALACAEPDNLDAREAMAMGSHYAGLCLSISAVGYVHAIAHQIGGHYGVPHGRSNAMVLPHVLRYYLPHCSKRMAALARGVGLAAAGSSDAVAAKQLVDRVNELLDGLPLRRDGSVVKGADIIDMSRAAMTEAHGLYAVPTYMSEADVRGIFEAVRQVA